MKKQLLPISGLLLSLFPICAFAQQVAPQFTISTVIGNGTGSDTGDGGPGTAATINAPSGLALDAAGNLYICEQGGNRIRKVAPDGTISTVAGNGTKGFSGDGGAATAAELNTPTRVSVDASGNLYIADYGNNRIRKVSNGIIATIAGNGTAGFSGDGGPATSAALNSPSNATVDAAGNLYIADEFNNRVRKVTNGVISTVAGNGIAGFSGDGGPATSAALDLPVNALVDASGNLLISDQLNQRIRKVTGGIITTIAGTGIAGFSGDGGAGTAAELHSPAGLALDAAGNLYFAEQDNQRVRVLLANGTIWTVAGSGNASFSGDGGSSTSAALDAPHAVAVDGSGAVYVADFRNNRIRLLTPVPQPPVISVSGVVPVFSAATTIQPGSWISIYGTSLASKTAVWDGNFPTMLAGTTVSINGKAAYIWFVSPTQINVQAPDDTTLGPVPVVVTTAVGSFTASVTLGTYGPSLSLLNAKYPAAIVPTTGPGNSGNGYDYIGPVGAFSFPTRPVKAGETILLYGVGFGPTTPSVPAGKLYSGAAPAVSTPLVTIGGVSALVQFAGIVEAGLFQFNVVVPDVPSGDQPLVAQVGGATTPGNVFLTVQ